MNQSAAISVSLIAPHGEVLQTWPLSEKKTFRIGRSKGNDILIDNSWVSRQHAMLQIEENGTVNVIDLGSANGTMVNGQRVYAPIPLRSGDHILIGGKSALIFKQDIPVSQNFDFNPDDEQTVAFITKTQVTILVCDIRRFTTLSEQIGDQEVSDIIRVWSQQCNGIVKRNHGRVDKFIGDAVMALWTGNGNPKQNIHQALQCAADIAAMTVTIGEKRKNLPWELSIGGALNTGEAAIGNIGVDGNRDYTVIGDTVNIVFRLEDLTDKAGKDFIIGMDVANHLEPRLIADFFTPCQYQVKGKTAPVTAYGTTFEELRRYLSLERQ